MKNINHHKIIDIIQMILFPRIGVKYLYQRESSIPPKTFPLPLARVIALLVSLLFSYLTVTPAFGQEPVGLGDVRPLKIGDTIPEELWDLPLQVVNHPDGKEVTRLSDYRDKKLIILDFWATWCGTCLDGLIKGAVLQREFGNNIAIIPVNSASSIDSYEKIINTLSSIKAERNLKAELFTVIQDQVLERAFIHKSLPHLVWIDEQGKVLNTTYSDALTKNNIDNYINGHKISLHTKKDNFQFDKGHSLANQIDLGTRDGTFHQLTFCKYIEGIGTEAGDHRQNSNYTSFRILNYQLSYFYDIAFRPELGGLERSQLIFDPAVNKEFEKSYINPQRYNDYYCFEYTKRGGLNKEEAVQKLRETLVSQFCVQPYRINKSVPTLVVSQTERLNQFLSKSESSEIQLSEYAITKYMRRYPIASLLDFLSAQMNIYIDNNVKSDLLFDIDVPDRLDCTDKQAALSFLKDIGLDVEEKVQNLDFAVFQSAELWCIPTTNLHYNK